MDILVKKPTETEIIEMQKCPTWGCDVSTFDWFYSEQETALIIDGKVTVGYGDKSITLTKGDYVTFPKNLSCTWHVTKPLNKHYKFD